MSQTVEIVTIVAISSIVTGTLCLALSIGLLCKGLYWDIPREVMREQELQAVPANLPHRRGPSADFCTYGLLFPLAILLIGGGIGLLLGVSMDTPESEPEPVSTKPEQVAISLYGYDLKLFSQSNGFVSERIRNELSLCVLKNKF